MAKGIYSSGMSCWERRKAGLPADHAGAETIPSEKETKAPVKEEKVEKVEKVEKKVAAKEEKKISKKSKKKKKDEEEK